MRVLIVICLVALSCADKLGYDYQPVAHSDEGLSFNLGGRAVENNLGHHGEAVLSQPIGQSLAQPIFQTQLQEQVQPERVQVSVPIATAAVPLAQPVEQPVPLIEEYQKEFYTYSAPADQPDETESNEQVVGIKKNLRVLFIRTPENRGIEKAALKLSQQVANEKTAIYVLHKQADIANLARQLQQIRSETQHKPEVHFVKYRTSEDAANAQKAIQNQYNQLPGASHISNEGEAPVLNFASRGTPASAPTPVQIANHGLDSVPAQPVLTSPLAEQASTSSVSHDYLPPSLRRFRIK